MFVEHPISAFFLLLCVILIVAQIYVRLRKPTVAASVADAADQIGQPALLPRREEPA